MPGCSGTCTLAASPGPGVPSPPSDRCPPPSHYHLRVTLAPDVRGLLRADAAARRIVRTHRALTRVHAGVTRDRERSTLLACSGGSDSIGLLAAFASSSVPLVVASIAHDIRDIAEVERDIALVASSAAQVGAPFRSAAVRVMRGKGNLEARARRERYRALEAIAFECGCRFVASAHHADDVLETMLMRMLRGAGPRGLAGPMPIRPLGDRGVMLVRPALGTRKADLARLATIAKLRWRHDETNDDPALLRNALRARVTPVLEELVPNAAIRAASTGATLRDLASWLDLEVASRLDGAVRPSVDLPAGSIAIDRRLLSAMPEFVLGEVIREAIRRLGGAGELDRIGRAELAGVCSAIKDGIGGLRTYAWGTAGRVVLTLDRTSLVLCVKPEPGQHSTAHTR